ncbi:MAG: thiol-disulfide oxidoreductase DCC family protein [Aquisalinus sp.]|nr:thiol-disulfide oxidoreductase DCC family protein [Aquisalinus sp.]
MSDTDLLSMSSPVIVFDGVCNICSHSVQFVLKRDSDEVFRFASMQGAFGSSLLARAGLDPKDPASFLLAENGETYQNSEAVIRILKKLGQPWPIAGMLFGLVPRPLRNALYNMIARNRYRWFGKKDSCPLPEPGVQNRFLL